MTKTKINRGAMMQKLDRYVVGEEKLKTFLVDAVVKQCESEEPQRVLVCGADRRKVWNMLRYLSDETGAEPAHWNMQVISNRTSVETVMENIVYHHDFPHSETEKLDINHIADADLMNSSTRQSMVEMLKGREFKTDTMGKVVDTSKMMFVFSIEKKSDEMSDEMRDELVPLMTAVHN